MWTVFKRKDGDPRIHFIGEDALTKLQSEVKAKTKQIRKRVGFVINDAGIVREHVHLFNLEGKEIG